VAAVAAAVLLLGGSFEGSSRAESVEAPTDTAAAQLAAGFSAGDTAAYAARLERRVAARPGDVDSLIVLGLAYQQRARETGDPSFYPRAAEALRRALRLDEDNGLAVTGLAVLATSRHRFGEALALAERARRLRPRTAGVYGALGDALVEIGRYDEAFAAFDRMAGLRPSLASYARVSYARELIGDTEGAITAMRLAVAAGGGNAENTAWALLQLGHLYFNSGRLAPAKAAYRAAAARFPGYVPADAALARIAAARGEVARAARLYGRAVEALPLPEYAVALGDVLAVAGRRVEARDAYALVGVLSRLFEANGVRTDLEIALFELDHGGNVVEALERARTAYRERRSIDAEDVLAWALYKNGRCEEARRHSVAALRLGTRDALKLFHRGLIESCLGKQASGRAFMRRALAINPHFSLLYAPAAKEVLR
jgi:tetratricopeptide (TPR) repeat protein